MPGLVTTPDESGLKSPSGGAVSSPGIYARAEVLLRALSRQQPGKYAVMRRLRPAGRGRGRRVGGDDRHHELDAAVHLYLSASELLVKPAGSFEGPAQGEVVGGLGLRPARQPFFSGRKVASLLALLALVTLAIKSEIEWRTGRKGSERYLRSKRVERQTNRPGSHHRTCGRRSRRAAEVEATRRGTSSHKPIVWFRSPVETHRRTRIGGHTSELGRWRAPTAVRAVAGSRAPRMECFQRALETSSKSNSGA